MNRPKVGQRVVIKNFAVGVDGTIGKIVRVDGEYYYVEITEKETKETFQLQCYIREMDIIQPMTMTDDLFDIEV